MSADDPRVWIRTVKLKGGRRSFHLRWIDPFARKWRSKAVRGDKRRADREAAKLEDQLRAGTYGEIRKITWQAFTDEIVGFLKGGHAGEAQRTLDEFGDTLKPATPKAVRPAMLRTYVQALRTKGNAVATVNKKLRYLRLAFRAAVALQYVAKNPLDGWVWDKVPKREKRILQRDEEPRLLESCDKLFGPDLRTFVRFVLETWGRLSEVTGLAWEDIDLADASVMFRDTKSLEDRFVPLDPKSDLLDELRRLRLRVLDRGPFVRFADRSNLHKKWQAIIADTGIDPITVHDLRRTGITRALLDGMAPVAVQKLAGHRDIKTTMEYYVEVDKNSLRAAVRNRQRAAG